MAWSTPALGKVTPTSYLELINAFKEPLALLKPTAHRAFPPPALGFHLTKPSSLAPPIGPSRQDLLAFKRAEVSKAKSRYDVGLRALAEPRWNGTRVPRIQQSKV